MSGGFTFDASRVIGFVERISPIVRQPMEDEIMLRGGENAQAIYLAEMRDQFKRDSRGGGEWPDLAPSTKLRRLARSRGPQPRQKGITRLQRLAAAASIAFPILYDSGTLYTSLFPGQAGNIFAHSPDSISAGIRPACVNSLRSSISVASLDTRRDGFA